MKEISEDINWFITRFIFILHITLYFIYKKNCKQREREREAKTLEKWKNWAEFGSKCWLVFGLDSPRFLFSFLVLACSSFKSNLANWEFHSDFKFSLLPHCSETHSKSQASSIYTHFQLQFTGCLETLRTLESFSVFRPLGLIFQASLKGFS